MKNTIHHLIKKELFALSISPSSYAAVLLFVLGTALNFFVVEQFFTIDRGSSDVRFLFSIMPYICILVIPSLTMNLWSGEHDFINSIAYSSFQINLAKFISSSIFFTGSLLLTLFIPLSASFFADIDVSQLVSGYFVMFLCGMSYIAVALYISLLLQNQIASFLITALLLFIINSVHLIPLYTSIPSVISSGIRFISFAWHFDAAGKGIIDSRDIFFYVTCITFFLCAAACIKEKRKGKTYRSLFLFLCFTAFSLFLVTVNVYYIRFDTTKSKLFSVSPVSETVVSGLEETITIRYYVSSDLSQLYPQVRNVKDFLRTFAIKTDKASLEIIDPDKEKSAQALNALGIKSEQIQTVSGNETSFVTVYSSIVIEYLNKTEIIPFILAADSLEYDLVNRIDSLIRGSKKTVYILEGTELTLEDDYSYVIPWLEASGYGAKTFDLEHEIPVLEDTKAPLVIIGSDFTDSTVKIIENFIMSGGKALFFVSGNETNIYADWSTYPKENNLLRSMLSYWGFSIEDGLLMDISNYRITMQSSDGNTYDYINYPLWISVLPQFVNNHPITQRFQGYELYWPSPLTIFSTEQSIISILAQSSSQSFVQKSFVSQADVQTYVTDPYELKTMSFASEEKKSYPVIALLEGTVPGYYSPQKSPETKIAVIPDQYAVSNMVEYTNSAHNLDIFVNTLLILSNDEELLSLKNKSGSYYGLYKITDEENFTRLKLIVLVFIFIVLPLAVISVPCSIALQRKHHGSKKRKNSHNN